MINMSTLHFEWDENKNAAAKEMFCLLFTVFVKNLSSESFLPVRQRTASGMATKGALAYEYYD